MTQETKTESARDEEVVLVVATSLQPFAVARGRACSARIYRLYRDAPAPDHIETRRFATEAEARAYVDRDAADRLFDDLELDALMGWHEDDRYEPLPGAIWDVKDDDEQRSLPL